MNYPYSTSPHFAGQKEVLPFLPCEICGKPVSLESANTDGDGKAVHEECYISEVSQRQKEKKAT